MADDKTAEQTDTVKKTQVRRTPEQRIKELEAKIKEKNKRHDAAVKKIEKQIEELKKPKLTKKEKEKKILAAVITKYGGVDKLAEFTGIDVEAVLNGESNKPVKEE